MSSHIDCEQFVIKQKEELLAVTKMNTQLHDIKCEIKMEPEDCVEFPDMEYGDDDEKDQILAEPQFVSTMKTESEVVDTSDFFHIELEDDEIKQENIGVDETNPVTEDPECLPKNSHVANRNMYYECNTLTEQQQMFNFMNTSDFQNNETITNLKPEAADKSKGEKYSRGKYIRTDQNQFKCNICCKIFNWKSSFYKHLHSHNSEKPFSCEICRKSFAQKYYLKNHLKLHYLANPYTCNICNESFAEKSSLSTHLNEHSGKKSFMCEICNKSLSSKCNRDKHKRLHDGQKPFHCKFCAKSFSRNSHLADHVQIHIGERHFSCNICGGSFMRKCNLTRHIQIHERRKTF